MVGQNVEHSRFGKGKITKIEGIDSNQKATIFFPHHGIKNLLLQFANLKILDQE
jgi:DNA helicase-2/ATP-dependent DNA helicase PcrA